MYYVAGNAMHNKAFNRTVPTSWTQLAHITLKNSKKSPIKQSQKLSQIYILVIHIKR